MGALWVAGGYLVGTARTLSLENNQLFFVFTFLANNIQSQFNVALNSAYRSAGFRWPQGPVLASLLVRVLVTLSAGHGNPLDIAMLISVCDKLFFAAVHLPLRIPTWISYQNFYYCYQSTPLVSWLVHSVSLLDWSLGQPLSVSLVRALRSRPIIWVHTFH